MAKRRYLAVDIGAESGRVVVGTLEGGDLLLEEIHRFGNELVTAAGRLHVDILYLYNNILKGMREYVSRFGETVDGIGIDTWGLDFGLLGADGALLENPIQYRDKRTEGMGKNVLEKISSQEIFERSGIGFQPFYTLGQMLSLRLNRPHLLDRADTFLMIPDLLAYFLTGKKVCERSNAISTQLYDPRQGDWCEHLFDHLDLPRSIMPEIVDPGTILGELDDSIKQSVGLKKAPVIAPCTHDTPSAVSAVPGKGSDWAFLNSGTWSVLGSLTEEVITSAAVNEGGICNEVALGSFFICKNIMGLWLLQQARAAWQREGKSFSYEELVDLASQAPEAGPLVNPDDSSFLNPPNMCQAIQDYCQRTTQTPPKTPAEISRCILESLAMCYRQGLDNFASILGHGFRVLNIAGGGSLNTLLCQLTCNVANIPAIAGPVEATVIGNVLVQAYACGQLDSPEAIREVVRNSTPLKEYTPKDTDRCQERYSNYLGILDRAKN